MLKFLNDINISVLWANSVVSSAYLNMAFISDKVCKLFSIIIHYRTNARTLHYSKANTFCTTINFTLLTYYLTKTNFCLSNL